MSSPEFSDPVYGNGQPAGNQSGGNAWLFAALMIGGGVLVTCCCGGGGIGYWLFGLFVNEAKFEICANPVVVEHLGDVTAFNTNLIATGEDDDDDVFVFDVEGTKGTGRITAELDDDVKLVRGSLRMSTGETYELVPLNAEAEPDE